MKPYDGGARKAYRDKPAPQKTNSDMTDGQLFDWLQEQVVDVICLDDGRVIQVRGECVRTAIRTAKARWEEEC